MKTLTIYCCLCWLLAWNPELLAQDKEQAGTVPAATNEAATNEDAVEEETVTTLAGFLAPVEEDTILLRPEEWSTFEVKSVVPHGSEVRAGDVLIEFDSREYDRKINDLEYELESARMALSQSLAQRDRLRKTVPLDLAKAERADQFATEELKLFLTIGKDQNIQTAKFNLKRSRDRLEYEEEELKQLLKMYQEDDLTEETEEIILRRTRDGVESTRFFHGQQALELEKTLEYEIPRKEMALEEAVRRAALELDRARIQGPADLEKQELEVQQQTHKIERLEEQVARFRQDEQWLRIRSPRTGRVVYGKHEHGQWEDPTAWLERLSPGGTCKIGVVLMTVFRERPLRVCTSTAEKDLPALREGETGHLSCPAVPDATWEVTLQSVARYPRGTKGYDAEWSIDVPADVPLRPGMSCEVKVAQ